MRTWATPVRRWASRLHLPLLAPMVAALVAAVSVLLLVLHGGPEKPVGLAATIPGCGSPVQVAPPATDLAAQVAARPEGSCFLLADGTYLFHDVVPKNKMAFIGASTAGVVVNGAGQENAFHGTADGVTIGQMTFAGFDNAMGTSAQEQAPIRGTSALWASNRGQMATNWLITNIVSRGNVASGVFLGDNFTVRNSELYDNAVTGIGGDSITGAVIEGNIIHHNGAGGAAGAAANGAGVKLTQAGTADKPVIVRNNELHDNQKEALWFDLGCHGIQVLDNYIHDHISRGVMFELSSGLVVKGNTILRSNTWTDFSQDFNAGAITVGESADALIEGNRIDTAQSAVVVRQTKRPYKGENLSAYPGLTFVSANVTVNQNLVSNSKSMGISMGTSRPGAIDPSTIRFTGNTYDAPSAMTFWWNTGSQTFAQWQAAGRDTTPAGYQLTKPEDVTARGPAVDPIVTPTTSTTESTTTSTGESTTTSTSETTTSTSGSTTSTSQATTTTRRGKPKPSNTRPGAAAAVAKQTTTGSTTESTVTAPRPMRWGRFLREEMQTGRRPALTPFRPLRTNEER